MNSVSRLNYSYEDALMALKSETDLEPLGIILCADVKALLYRKIYYPAEKEIILLRSVKNRSVEKVITVLDEIYKANFIVNMNKPAAFTQI